MRELTVQFLQENNLANKLISVNHLSALFNGFAGVGCDPKLAVKFDEDIFSQSFSNASESSIVLVWMEATTQFRYKTL